ncbi:MAG: S8 family serine peptidase [Candidatus Heimdallarchaeota archaeon]|nr:S8 family serine peptidase [Candidatus Heimdallarchaeota archaeon]
MISFRFILFLLLINQISMTGLVVDNKIQLNNDYVIPIVESRETYVYFADSQQNYEQMKTIEHRAHYDHIRTIILDLSKEEMDIIKTINYQVYRYDDFSQLSFSPVMSSPGLKLDNSDLEMDTIGITEMWDIGYNGSGVALAVVDNGVQPNHPALEEALIESVNFNLTPDGTSYPVCMDHGTLVAGTAVGNGDLADGSNNPSFRGPAFGADIVAVNMGCEGNTIVGDIFAAFDWIIANNASIDIVNMSWGGGTANFDTIMQILESENIIAISSAGNAGPAQYTVSSGPGLSYPTITVGASCIKSMETFSFACLSDDPEASSGLAEFSSRGPGPGFNFKPDITAPGYNIYAPNVGGGYTNWYGTSAASPMASGGIATLISAIRANNITYNPGVIKAAIMKAAQPLGGFSELDEGKGDIHVFDAWNFILDADRIDNIPLLVDMSPRRDTAPLQAQVFSNLQMQLPLTIISSYPSLTEFSISGNISQILSYNDVLDTNKFSQKTYLDVNTYGAQGYYEGTVTAILGNDSVSATYRLDVGEAAAAKVLMDLGHTSWDNAGLDGIGGSNTGEMVNIALSKSFWVDEFHDILTSDVLNRYDILWMPDPLDLGGSEILLNSEITAIENFVLQGGSVFIDFNGKLNDPIYGLTGTDTYELNRLLNKFSITSNNEVINAPSDTREAIVINYNSLGKDVSSITHFGNFLTVSENAVGVASVSGKITVAMNDLVNGGRVLVSSSNFWLDNAGALGMYPSGYDDVRFCSNTWDWLSSSEQVKRISFNQDKASIEAKFQVINNGTVVVPPDIIRTDQNGISILISPIDLGNGIWGFNDSITQDGRYKYELTYMDEFSIWYAYVDTQAPYLAIAEGYYNQSIFNRDSSILLKFTAGDAVTELQATDFDITLDTTTISPSYYSYADHILRLFIYKSYLNDDDAHLYNLNITVTDSAGNTAFIIFQFAFSDVFTETETITSVTSQTIMTTTQTSEEQSTQVSSLSDTNDTPVFGLSIMILLGILFRRRKF